MINLMEMMKSQFNELRKQENVNKLYKYFQNKEYLVLFLKQYEVLISNLKSICILVDSNLIEDAFTIFRKLLETYFTLMSILNHPDLVTDYLIHNKYIVDKVTNKKRKEINEIRKNHPDGYIEYGYIEKYIKDTKYDKFTMRRLAEVAGVEEYYEYYNKCNNFVHNNLTSINVDLKKAKEALYFEIDNTINSLINKVNTII